MPTMVTPGTTLQRSSEPWTVEAEDELVMLTPSSGTYYALDSVARRIWELLETPMSASALVTQLAEEYDAPQSTMSADLDRFLEQLLSAGLVRVVPAAETP